MDEKLAIYLAENASVRDAKDAWQFLADTGLIFTLPAWFGRMASALITVGAIEHPSRLAA